MPLDTIGLLSHLRVSEEGGLVLPSAVTQCTFTPHPVSAVESIAELSRITHHLLSLSNDEQLTRERGGRATETEGGAGSSDGDCTAREAREENNSRWAW